jgi:hypothetical protein
MSKQFRVFIVPSDIQSILDRLRSKVGLRVIEETAPSQANRSRITRPQAIALDQGKRPRLCSLLSLT